MRAFILAAGLGTRLKPLTDKMPKALVPVGGIPLLERQITTLKEYGYSDFVVNVHHFAEQIEQFLADKHNFGCRIAISDERDLLRETGGAIRHAAPLLEGSGAFLVHNVDIITDLDYGRLVPDPEAVATLAVSSRRTNRYLLFDKEMHLAGWTNTATGQTILPRGGDASEYRRLAFSGIQSVSTGILPLMASWPEKFSIMDFYLDICRFKTVAGIDIGDTEVTDVGKAADIAR